MRGFELVHPATLGEAIALLDTDDESVRAFSGGTALMLMLKSGLYKPTRFVHLGAVEAAHARIEATPDGGLRIGAMATLSALEHNAEVAKTAPVISRAMKHLSNVRVRNVARVGGALAHGDPHMDLPPILAALGADVVVAGPRGERRIAVEALYTGYYETALTRGELIVAAVVPAQAGWRSVYLKCTTRAAEDWPALGVAVSIRLDGGVIADARVMIGAATAMLTRATSAEAALRGAPANAATFERAAEAAAAATETIDDASGSAAYKTELLRVYLRRALAQAIAGE